MGRNIYDLVLIQEMSNRPDIVRLVDCNKRAPEPKYKYDENVLGNVVAEYKQINTGTSGIGTVSQDWCAC